MPVIGTVARLDRYPVKSMLGETVDRLEMVSTGVVGDRVCALIDQETGKVASAKLPHRWRAMLTLASRLPDGVDERGRPLIELALPDGTRVRTDRADLDDVLSAALGRSVTLAFARPADLEIERAWPDEVADQGVDAQVAHDTLMLGAAAPDGGFVDYAPVHLIASASLESVAAATGAAAPEPIRFRGNMVFDSVASTPFTENDWVGHDLHVGEEVVLRVMAPTPRCAVPTLQHGDTPANTGITREIGKLNRVEALGLGLSACLGAYAHVVRGGVSRVGDVVRLERSDAS